MTSSTPQTPEPPEPFSEEDLRLQWNAQADQFNQWDSISLCEQLAWAQARAIAADRARRPQAAVPLTDQLSLGVAELFPPSDGEIRTWADSCNMPPETLVDEDDDDGYGIIFRPAQFYEAVRAALARWGRPATPLAQAAGEVPEPTHEQIAQWINANPVLRPGATGGPAIRVGTDWVAAFADAARWGAQFRPTTTPAPAAGEGEAVPTIDDIWDLCEGHNFCLGVDGTDEEEGAEILRDIILTALARWGRPAAPPAPSYEEVEKLAEEFHGDPVPAIFAALARWGGGGR